MAVEAVPVEEEEEEPEEELTPEELTCEACRGRHVKHTCGTDPEERKGKNGPRPRRGERKRKKLQNGSRRWKKRGRPRWRPRSRPTRRLPS